MTTIKSRPPSVQSTQASSASSGPRHSVGGQVLSMGSPVANLEVRVKGSNQSIKTGPNGEYRLDLPPGNHVLVIRGKEYQLNVAGNSAQRHVSLGNPQVAQERSASTNWDQTRPASSAGWAPRNTPATRRQNVTLLSKVPGDDPRPIANLKARVVETGTTLSTGPDGKISLDLPPGKYHLEIRGKQYEVTIPSHPEFGLVLNR